tara:strand:- start:920 stop:1171 length:252 start_codon:yes stop_codon:yes gene_type:complete
MNSFFQKIFKWMPVVLFFLLIMVDRGNIFHVVGYILLLLSYTAILVLRLMYAKEDWHKEYNKDGQVGNNHSINKLDDFKDNLN